MNWRLPYASLGITPSEDNLSLHYPREITEAMILSIRIYAHCNLVHPLDLPSRIKRVILWQSANASIPGVFHTFPPSLDNLLEFLRQQGVFLCS